MQLSIVIVNYNVLSFLRQCLTSIKDACRDIDHEIIVIDNASKDGSQGFIKNLEQDNLECVYNDTNLGFGKAMNQGFKMCKGKFVLILNPDTVVSFDAINKSLDYLLNNPDCGSVGVRMIDGQGSYLRESKRGLPTWKTSIFKILGLATVFQNSAEFSAYYFSKLGDRENGKVDVLTGAYLMTRKKILDEVNGFDERYFMYGEDIDLSVNITKLGYYNYYVGESSIVHFKGESTQKERLSNTFHFYNSMLLFVKKHYPGNRWFLFLITVILGVLGINRWIGQRLKPLLSPLLRLGLYWFIFWLVSGLWARFYFDEPSYYDVSNHQYLIFIYGVILTVSHLLYASQKTSFRSTIFSLFLGFLLILLLYSLLPETWRSSRAIIVLGISCIAFLEAIQYLLYNKWQTGKWNWRRQNPKAILVGEFEPSMTPFENLKRDSQIDYLGIAGSKIENHQLSLVDYSHLPEFLKNNNISILTMNMEAVSMDIIMGLMTKLGPNYKYLLYSNKAQTIVDSPSSNQRGLVTTIEISWNIDSLPNRWIKRLADIGLSIVFLVLSPVLIWFIKGKKEWLRNIIRTFTGGISWVGYNQGDGAINLLPKIKPGVLQLKSDLSESHSVNLLYARNYSLITDLEEVIRRFSKLGDKVEIHA